MAAARVAAVDIGVVTRAVIPGVVDRAGVVPGVVTRVMAGEIPITPAIPIAAIAAVAVAVGAAAVAVAVVAVAAVSVIVARRRPR